MATVKRFNRLLGLDNIDVLIDERNTSRHIIITDMPQSLPQGKSSFLIEVSPYMKEGVELQIDFMDSIGNSVYVEPVQNYLEGSSRTISIEVYDTAAAGIATIIIVGELDEIPTQPGNYSEVDEVPEDFQGVYNVRLTREVIINTAQINMQPIKFYSSPKLTATEKRFGTMEREVVEGEVVSDEFTVTGIPITQQAYEVFSTGEDDSAAQGAGVTVTNENKKFKPPKGDKKGDKAEKEKLKQHTKKRSIRVDSTFKRSKRIRKRNSPVEYPYAFTITNDAHTFTSKEIGGEIRFSDIETTIYNTDDLQNNGLGTPTFNVVSDVLDENFPSHYTASIADLNNSITAYTNTPFTKQDNEGSYRILEMKANGKVHYEKQPSASFSLSNIVSYANITLSHLRTFSGELFKAKVYVRSEGSFDDYKLLAEIPIESPELMVNDNSVGIGERTGYFVDDLDLNKYWFVSGSTNGLSIPTSTSTASYDNSTIIDSVMVSGSTSVFTDQIRFQLKEDYKFTLTRDIDYTLSFNAVGQKDIDGRALMLIYVSGSCMKQSNIPYYDEITDIDIEESSTYGKRMGVLEVEPDEDNKKDFKIVSHNFNTNLTGDATVQFRIVSGQWNLSDISVVPATDTGFSPAFVNFKQELPPDLTHKRPDTFEFLTEFYDVNNNIADEVAVTTGSIFAGGNMVITGDDNNMSGDFFIGGDSTGSGIHMGGVNSILPETGQSGANGSGFFRSVGYQGFISASAQSGSFGFMIYSGSVLPDSGDDYKGVGLELVGVSGSLKFRTNPSVFDVQADSFFVGKQSTQFVSGSLGNIEISSSNFHLDNAGNVIMSGKVTAAEGEIGGLTIGDTKLSSGTSYEISSSTNTADPVSFISSSKFKVSAGGQVTASALSLTGGDIFGTEISKIQAGAVSASAAIGPTGNLTANLTGTIGGTANATVLQGAAKGEAAIDGSGIVTAAVSGNLTGTIGGVANATALTAVSRANAAIDGDNKIVGDLKAGTATIGGIAVNTVRDRAITAVSDYIVYSDTAAAGSSSGDGASVLPTYIQTGAAANNVGNNKNKVVCVYKHDVNNLFLSLTCLLKQSADTAASALRCRLGFGITDITADAGYAAFASSNQPLGDVSVTHLLASDYGSTFINQTLNLTKLTTLQIDSADLVDGRLYQLTVSLRGGVNAARDAVVTVSMLAPTITATGVDL